MPAEQSIKLFRRHELFADLSDADLRRLDFRVSRRTAEAGEVLVHEGEPGCNLYIIEEGAVGVVRESETEGVEHRIAILESGANFGELALLDNGPRSATVRALTRTRLIVIDTKHLGRPDATLDREHAPIYRQLARMLSARLRGTNNVAVAALERELESARLRLDMAKFFSALILVLCGYAFVIRFAASLRDSVASTTLLTVPLLLCFGAIVLLMIQRSRYPWSTYGLTIDNWREDLKTALIRTIPIMALATVLKWLLIQLAPSFAGESLLSLNASVQGGASKGSSFALVMAAVYALVVPLQELTTRGALQGSLHMFLSGPRRDLIAILVSNAVFTACHLHLSIGFALLAFFPGLVWGFMYARSRSLLGVSVSHVLLGVWAFYVLGLEAVLPI